MQITLLRHAHSEPARDDKNRVLSPRGIAQALNFKKTVGKLEYDLVIHSSALRTKETADILYLNSEFSPKYIEISSLYLPSNSEDIQIISKAIMLYPTLPAEEMIKKDQSHAWERYTSEAFESISSAINGMDNNLRRVLIIGHGTITNLLACKFTNNNYAEMRRRYLGYLEGFSVHTI